MQKLAYSVTLFRRQIELGTKLELKIKLTNFYFVFILLGHTLSPSMPEGPRTMVYLTDLLNTSGNNTLFLPEAQTCFLNIQEQFSYNAKHKCAS